jgi:hypothetical protein
VEVEFKNKGKQERLIQTQYGALNLARTVYEADRQRSGGGAAYFVGRLIALDEFLETERLAFKMTKKAMLTCARFGQFAAYESAGEMLRDLTSIQVSDSLIEEVTDHIGKFVFEADKERAEETDRNMARIDYKENSRKGVFCLQIDGGMGNTRQKDKNGSTWREVKVALMYAEKDCRMRSKDKQEIMEKEYVACTGNVEEFGKYLFEAAVRHDCFAYEKIVIISDGAAWIRVLCLKLFPDAVQILDFYHLKENLYTFGKYNFGNDEKQYVPWVEGLLWKLQNGHVKEAIGELGCFAGKIYPLGILNPFTYVMNNKEKVNYAEYREKGYTIGSGAIESGIKTVVQKRCKQAGMQWNLPTLQTMVTLRSKAESRRWAQDVQEPFLQAA